METQERISTAPAKRAGKEGFSRLVGAAAVVLLLVVGVAGWASIRDGEDAAVSPEIAVAIAAYDALNDGDVDAYLALFSDEAAPNQGRDVQELLVASNSQTELVEPCRLLDPSPTSGATRVQCRVSMTDDWYAPARVGPRFSTDTFIMSEAGDLTSVLVDFVGPYFYSDYNSDFWAWLDGAHPEVAAAIAPVYKQTSPGRESETPADMLTALEYVDEFIAQSDVYPLTD